MNLRGLTRSMIGRLPRSVLYEAFYQSARALGVRSYEVNGKAGAFFGPIYDQSVTRVYLETGAWSENIVSLFHGFFGDEGGTMYDIGANIGLVSVPVARLPGVRVVAFEPDGHNCALLRANVAAAQVPVEVVNAAVSDSAGTVSFARSEYNSGDHHLSQSGGLSVRSLALDDYPPGPGQFAVKIDTQGAEPLIFRGSATVLAQAGLIVSEFWPWGMRRMGLEPGPVLDFARRHFDRGLALGHSDPVSEPQPIAGVLERLQGVVEHGGEHDAVDFVLFGRESAALPLTG